MKAYACNCHDNKHKPYKYTWVPVNLDEQCILCGYYAVQVAMDQPLRTINDVLFDKTIDRVTKE